VILLGAFCVRTEASSDTAVTSERIREFQKRLEDILKPEGYHYKSYGKVDPFQSFIETTYDVQGTPDVVPSEKKEKQAPVHCASRLECMDVGQLTIVAIVREGGKGVMAMAQDASGLGYVLIPGMKVGYRNGIIEDIQYDRVIIREEYESVTGEMLTRTRELFLHPEEK
jgi:Tfp pilus assembly protein PilP